TEMKKPDFKPDKNFLLLFFLTEPEVKNLNAMLFELYSKGIKAEDTDFFFYILISMDKALVSGDFKPGIIWGDIFYKEAEHTRFYTEGIYLYSCLLFARKDYKSLNRIMDEILESEKKTPSVDKTLLLKSYKPENTFYLKRSFIKNSLKSRYRSLIFRNLIRFYRRQGKHKIATKLNKILLKIQKKELLEENIKKLSGVNMKM
ncbi:MAG: hypothetical protein KDK45_24920, partial [Leptospiraceae bacterium]|nr:hypothetical protein [Leptospiraceae bacterium]